jgi:hypothetical protein
VIKTPVETQDSLPLAMKEALGYDFFLFQEGYGSVPDGPSLKSVTVLQNELAAAACRSRALRRLIWLPDGTRSGQDAQRKFIEALEGDPEFQFGRI